MATQAPLFVDFHVKTPKDNGVPEALQGLLKVRQVFQCRGWQVRSDKWGLSEPGDDLTAYHVWLVLEHGINNPTNGPLPLHQANVARISPGTGRTLHQKIHIVAETIM